ncbi:integral membrane protein pth11-like protein [Colletotrichum musicola]|uniref:Integral membrane protein pth11-like protein n=1 Tax=Colletotrichum musicola TaxID=2175873 RepID=A0A8H6NFH6_9PEZI|nr:integral membrane protein pth11-like protein [Colletotrichum musicola]
MSAAEAQRFIREVWGLQGAAYLVVGLRYYGRAQTLGWRKFSWDDALMGVAVLVYTAESVAAYFVVAYWQGLANNGMTEEQRAALDPASSEHSLRVNGSKTHVIGLLLYTTLLWLLKGCWIIYYSRLTAGVHKMKRIIFWGMIIMPVTYVACLIVAFFKCIPFDRQWQIYPNPGNSCMPAISFIQTIFVMALNTATDFYLMAIPLPMVWKSGLPWRKKVTLMIMFSGGFLEMTFGILRCVSILTVGDTDPAQSGYWSVRESFVSVVLTNMPMVYPLFKSVIDKSRSLSTNKASALGDSQGYRLGSYPGKQQPRSNPLSVPGETTYGSNEHIVGGDASEKGAVSLSGGEEASSIASDKQPTSPYLPHHVNGAEVVADGKRASARPRNQHEERNQIVVTTEYCISRATPEPRRASRQDY